MASLPSVPPWLPALLVSLIVVIIAWKVFARRRFLASSYARRAQERQYQQDSLGWRLQKAGFRPGANPEASLLMVRLLLAVAAAVISAIIGFPLL